MWSFLTATAILVVANLASSTPTNSSNTTEQNNRPSFYGLGSDYPLFPLQENAETPNLFPMPPCGTFILEEATIDQMQDAMSKGQVTSQQLVICYMQRIFQTNSYIK
jgi:hypothetical protein